MNNEAKLENKKVVSYVVGFITSVILTFVAYWLVVSNSMEGSGLLVTLGGLALVQMTVQLFFFLHAGNEPKPYWRLAGFVSMFGVLFIVVAGSLWIMSHLDYNMMHMPKEDVEKRMEKESGF